MAKNPLVWCQKRQALHANSMGSSSKVLTIEVQPRLHWVSTGCKLNLYIGLNWWQYIWGFLDLKSTDRTVWFLQWDQQPHVHDQGEPSSQRISAVVWLGVGEGIAMSTLYKTCYEWTPTVTCASNCSAATLWPHLVMRLMRKNQKSYFLKKSNLKKTLYRFLKCIIVNKGE